MNTFGELFRVSTFGESHGVGLGALVDGCPAGVPFTVDALQAALDRRRPGQSALTTPRAEADRAEVLSGVHEGRTLGTPVAVLVRNTDARSQDYSGLKDRPGHADAVWRAKFGHVDPRGGGRTSGRETLCRVIGGALAEALLARDAPGVRIVAWVSQVGPVHAEELSTVPTRADVDAHPTRCPAPQAQARMRALIEEAKAQGDSWGGVVSVRVDGLPAGWGEPVFGKLKARLADAWVGVGAVNGVLFGEDAVRNLERPGSSFHQASEGNTPSGVYGGIQGGLSTGAPLVAQVLFKPPATLADVAKAGRHDPCILPRAVPVVEAMAALVLADALLLARAREHRP